MIKVILNKNGVKQLLKSEVIKDFVEKKAESIAKKCGDGYETNSFVGKNRVNASISTSSTKAMFDNSENNTILKNMR